MGTADMTSAQICKERLCMIVALDRTKTRRSRLSAKLKGINDLVGKRYYLRPDPHWGVGTEKILGSEYWQHKRNKRMRVALAIDKEYLAVDKIECPEKPWEFPAWYK